MKQGGKKVINMKGRERKEKLEEEEREKIGIETLTKRYLRVRSLKMGVGETEKGAKNRYIKNENDVERHKPYSSILRQSRTLEACKVQ